MVACAMMVALIAYLVKKRTEPLRAGLLLTAAIVFLSPTAYPWYFTWSIPFLCFYPAVPWLLMSVTAVLGYTPVIAYAAGLPYNKVSPLILALEYAPVYLGLAYYGGRTIIRHHLNQGQPMLGPPAGAQ